MKREESAKDVKLTSLSLKTTSAWVVLTSFQAVSLAKTKLPVPAAYLGLTSFNKIPVFSVNQSLITAKTAKIEILVLGAFPTLLLKMEPVWHARNGSLTVKHAKTPLINVKLVCKGSMSRLMVIVLLALNLMITVSNALMLENVLNA